MRSESPLSVPPEIKSNDVAERRHSLDLKRRTSEMEYELEKEGMARLLARYLKISLTSLLLSVPFGETFAQSRPHEVLPKSEQEKVVEHETGLARKDIEAMGFRVSVDVKSPSGEYIIHVGQTHIPPEKTADPKESLADVIESQKKIEQLLLALQRTHTVQDVVYAEAVVKGDKYFAYLANLRDTLAHIPETLELTSELRRLHREVSGEYPNSSAAQLIIAHLFFQKMSLVPNKERDVVFSKTLAGIGSLLQHDVVYVAGAVEKLFSEGRIRVEGAETREANERAGKVVEDMKRLLDEGEARDPARRADKEFTERIRQVFQRRDADILERREDAALEIISRDPSGNRNPVLVYGSGHDFSNNIINLNEKAGAKRRYGLIKIKSK